MEDKKSFSEINICTSSITPALGRAGRDKILQIVEVVFFKDGKIYLCGKITSRDPNKRAYNILQGKQNISVAIIEAKDNNHSIRSRIQQVAFDKPPLTRNEQANGVKKRNYFVKDGDQARKVFEALLNKYADKGIVNIEHIQSLTVPPINEFGIVAEFIKTFGSPEENENAAKELENDLYKVA